MFVPLTRILPNLLHGSSMSTVIRLGPHFDSRGEIKVSRTKKEFKTSCVVSFSFITKD